MSELDHLFLSQKIKEENPSKKPKEVDSSQSPKQILNSGNAPIKPIETGGVEPYDIEKYNTNIKNLCHMIFRSIRDQEPRSLFLESFKGLNPDLSLNISTKWNEDGTFNNELLEYENLKIETEKFYRIMGDITTVQTKISERIKFIRKDPTKPLSGADLPYLIASTVEPTISIIALSILPSLILWWWPLVPLAGLSTVTAGSSIRALDITLKVKKQHNAGVSEGNLQKPLETINEINEGKIPSVEALRTAASELITPNH